MLSLPGMREAVMRLLKKLDEWVRDRSHCILGLLEYRLAPLTLTALLAVLAGSTLCWDSWRGMESNGPAIRNLVLAMAAIAALPLAIWRSKVAERQAATAQRQSETAQRGLLNGRYQKGAEMLGGEVLAVRLGGIYALDRLAREHPGDYHTQIMKLLCAFVRNPPRMKPHHRKLREDVQEIMTAVCSRSDSQIEAEKGEYCLLELSGANLEGLDLINATLKKVVASSGATTTANLNGAVLTDANLRGASMISANLRGAYLNNADLDGALLHGTDLTGANMSRCKGLTQEQIDDAEAEPDKPPDLTDVVDAKTSKSIGWRPKAAKLT